MFRSERLISGEIEILFHDNGSKSDEILNCNSMKIATAISREINGLRKRSKDD